MKEVLIKEHENLDVEWLKLIYTAKQHGLSKEEIRNFLHHYAELKKLHSL